MKSSLLNMLATSKEKRRVRDLPSRQLMAHLFPLLAVSHEKYLPIAALPDRLHH